MSYATFKQFIEHTYHDELDSIVKNGFEFVHNKPFFDLNYERLFFTYKEEIWEIGVDQQQLIDWQSEWQTFVKSLINVCTQRVAEQLLQERDGAPETPRLKMAADFIKENEEMSEKWQDAVSRRGASNA